MSINGQNGATKRAPNFNARVSPFQPAPPLLNEWGHLAARRHGLPPALPAATLPRWRRLAGEQVPELVSKAE